ncbi:MAG: tetratricopeptide repeat protein [Betaproteobacteria bacterium]
MMTAPVNIIDEGWEQRIAALWLAIDDHEPAAFVALIDTMVGELPPGETEKAIGLFEQACARDSTGHPDLAVPKYQAALDIGLTGIRRRRAVIQMSSSLRNLGEAATAVKLLTAELDAPSDELDGAVRAVLALALVSAGREREAVAHCLMALSKYLPRYNRSMARYAQALTDPPVHG